MTENDFAAPRAGRLRYWNYVAVYGLLAAIVLYPIAVVNIPGLEDYPNHLARMYILSHFKSSPDLQRFYQVRWQPIPYVGMDAAFLLLNRIAPVYDAGRILIGFCVLLPVAAVATLHYSIHRRVSLVPAAAFLLSYNALLRWGFLSYLSTLCLAVMVFAGWIATTNWSRWRRLIVFALLATALYLGHLVAFAAYCLLVLCFELSRAAKAGFQERGAILADWVFAALQAAPAIVLASSITVSDRLVGPPLTEYGTFQDKVRGILSPILFQLSKVEIVTGLVLLVVIIFARITGRVRFSQWLFGIVVIVGVLSFCIPVRLLGVFGMDFRLPLLASMLLLSAISMTTLATPLFRNSILCLILLLTAARSVVISRELREADDQIAELRQVIAAMPRGMRLLTVETGANLSAPNSTLVTFHAPLVAVIDRDAFVPTLSTGNGLVKPAPAFKESSSPMGSPYPDVADLVDGYGKLDPKVDIPARIGERIYWLGWERKFDYVLVAHYGQRPPALPRNLRLVASSTAGDLYEIDKPSTITPSTPQQGRLPPEKTY